MTRLSAPCMVLVLLGVLLAGCLGASETDRDAGETAVVIERSEALFSLLPGESVFYEASTDDTQLHMRLFRPDTADDTAWKAPTILVMSPYFGPDSKEGADRPAAEATMDPAARPAYWRYQWLIDHFVARGYTVAFADVRGTGESGGCLEQTAKAQTQDGYDTVQWLTTQEWSNGNVGMYGKSYDGETQQATATLAPPGLVTIVPVSSVAGQYDYSYYDGVPYTFQTMLSNGFYIVGDGMQPGSSKEAAMQLPTRAGCNDEILLQGADDSGDWNTFWEEREFRKQVDGVEASVLYVHGLQDWNVKPNNIRDWYEHLDVPKVALLGQWGHDYPEENRVHPDWSRQDWQELVWRWYDHWLLGLDTGVDAMLGEVQVQDTLGRWRVEAAFPPPATPTRLWLGDDGLHANATSGTPRDYQEGRPDPLGASPDELPALDALVYRTEALTNDLHWSGWPELTINVSLDRDDAHFAVWLVDITPDGSEQWVNKAYLSARHRDGVDAPNAVPIGETVTYDLRFFPGDTVIEAGHRLGLRIAPEDVWTSGSGNAHTATVHGGVLTLPVVTPGEERFRDYPMGDPITAPVTE
ncbi:MAG: CocE/NonD family hydrolase [Euryarchaeota archaeon]|nr:CocE/NonD family hydrolase [Euryarchaeota archaeon]